MPTLLERKRGVKYYRTVKLSRCKYIHVAITKKRGPRGGRTISGKVYTKKHCKLLK